MLCTWEQIMADLQTDCSIRVTCLFDVCNASSRIWYTDKHCLAIVDYWHNRKSICLTLLANNLHSNVLHCVVFTYVQIVLLRVNEYTWKYLGNFGDSCVKSIIVWICVIVWIALITDLKHNVTMHNVLESLWKRSLRSGARKNASQTLTVRDFYARLIWIYWIYYFSLDVRLGVSESAQSPGKKMLAFCISENVTFQHVWDVFNFHDII